ncbi:MAG: hypothetical protein DME05_22410 [Candidatus Rokuibacteriota bacterium]|nr:MAG: hypothetical protein DME05_22410 [Candidatus Rokubacteria bacterium]
MGRVGLEGFHPDRDRRRLERVDDVATRPRPGRRPGGPWSDGRQTLDVTQRRGAVELGRRSGLLDDRAAECRGDHEGQQQGGDRQPSHLGLAPTAP